MHSAWNLFIDVFIMHARRKNDFPCAACICLCKTVPLMCAWFSSRVPCVSGKTGQALTDEGAFVLTSLRSGFTLREIWFSHFTLLLTAVWGYPRHAPSVCSLCVCDRDVCLPVCVCVSAYVWVFWCACIFASVEVKQQSVAGTQWGDCVNVCNKMIVNNYPHYPKWPLSHKNYHLRLPRGSQLIKVRAESQRLHHSVPKSICSPGLQGLFS